MKHHAKPLARLELQLLLHQLVKLREGVAFLLALVRVHLAHVVSD